MINVFLIGIDCYKPANGETVSMETIPTISVDMSLELLKRKVESLQRKGQSNNMHGLELDDRPIEHKPSTKLLGVHIDEMLT